MTKSISRPARALPALVAAALFAGMAFPAHAGSGTGSTNDSARAENPRADRAAREREICVRADFTGSRVRRLVCKTAAEWEAAGGQPTK